MLSIIFEMLILLVCLYWSDEKIREWRYALPDFFIEKDCF